MRTILVLLLAALALTGCHSGSPSSPAAATSAAPAHQAGPTEFARQARISGFGDKDFTDASDAQLLTLGNTICTGFADQGLSYGQVSAGLDAASAHASEAQVASLVKSAVTNLCPQEASQLP